MRQADAEVKHIRTTSPQDAASMCDSGVSFPTTDPIVGFKLSYVAKNNAAANGYESDSKDKQPDAAITK
jgi:hypothetical protein